MSTAFVLIKEGGYLLVGWLLRLSEKNGLDETAQTDGNRCRTIHSVARPIDNMENVDHS